MGLTRLITVRGDTLTLKVKIEAEKTEVLSLTDRISCSELTATFNVLFYEYSKGLLILSVCLCFSKPYSATIVDDETFRVTSEAMFIKNRTFKNDNNNVLVYINKLIQYRSEIDIKVQVMKPTLNKFYEFFDDADMTDFELRVDDGCVRFHRLVLAASSPVLKTMLSGKWKETTQGHVEVPGISKNTVEQFKEYIYKSVVPDNVSLELLSLASYYMMTELEDICLEKLADSLTSENSWSQLEYCVLHKLANLLTVILNRLKYGQIDDNVFVKGLNSELNG